MPKNKIQCQKIVDSRKNKICQASLSVFAIKGYDNARVDDVAKQAKCSRALVYHYFEDKDELFISLMSHVREHIFAVTEQIDYNAKASIALANLIDSLLINIKNDVHFAEAIYLVLNLHLQGNTMPRPKNKPTNIKFGQRILYEIVSILIEKGQQEGDFMLGEIKQFAISLLTMLTGLAYNRIYLGDKYCSPETKIIMNLLRRKDN